MAVNSAFRQQSFSHAVESVVRTFMQKMHTVGQMDVEEALEGFWRAKKDDTVSIRYSSSKIGESFLCYVLLPGGSCYGSHKEFLNISDAQESASKIALMNSLFNEHPSRKVSSEYIQQVIQSVATTPSFSELAIEGLKTVLEFMEGKTLMEVQELNNTIRLLHWAGRSADPFFVSRNQYLEYGKKVDFSDSFRLELAMELMEKEQEVCGFLESELSLARRQLEEARSARKELRFCFEKEQICQLALQQLECEYGQDTLA